MNIHGMFEALSQANALCFLPARLTEVLTNASVIREVRFPIAHEQRDICIWYGADTVLNRDITNTIKRARSFIYDRLTRKDSMSTQT